MGLAEEPALSEGDPEPTHFRMTLRVTDNKTAGVLTAAEDWEGMSAEEIVAQAKDASIKRHADNQEISDEEMKKIVDVLLAE